MFNDVSQALVISFGWLCLVTGAYYGVQRIARRWTLNLWSVLLLAALVRIVPLLVLPIGAGYDIESFRRVGQTFAEGKDIYTSVLVAGRHPYLPLQLYLIGGATELSTLTIIPFVILVKLPNVLADLAIVGLIYTASFRAEGSVDRSARLSTLYALNPIPMLISAYHGQFDAFTILLILFAWYAWQLKPQRIFLSAVCLGLAVLDKTWPLLFLPLVVLRLPDWKSRFSYCALTAAVPIAGILVYMIIWQANLQPILTRPLSHFGVPGWWGLGAVLNLLQSVVGRGAGLLAAITPFSSYVLLTTVGIAAWLTRRQSILDSWVTCLLVVYAVTLGFGLQYLVWIVPFAIYVGERRWLNWFTAGALVYLVLNYYGLHMDSLIARLLDPNTGQIVLLLAAFPIWLVVWRWLFARWRNQTIYTDRNYAPTGMSQESA